MTARRPTFRPRLEALESRTVPTAGALDPSFDGDGKVLTDIGRSSSDVGYGVVAYQSDGKAIVVGESEGDIVVVRYNADGSLDATFGTGGKVRFDFGGTDEFGVSVAVDSQDRVLVAGWSFQGITTDNDFVVARLTAAGALDTTFDGDGRQTIDFGGTYDIGNSVAVDSQDRVLVAGHSYQEGTTGLDFAVARLTAAGALDGAFDGDGKHTVDFGSFDDYGLSLAVDSQDRVLLVGSSYQGGTTEYDFAVARLTAAGALDGAFDGDGKQTIDFGSTDEVAISVAVDSQDRVVVAGYSSQVVTGYDFAVARLTATGALDITFDGDGKRTIDFGNSDDIGYGVAVDSQDRVVVAGYSSQGTTGSDFAVARLTATGALDAAFDGDGRQTIDFGSSTQESCFGVAVDSQDRVLAAGYSYQGVTRTDFAVARLTAAGVLDAAFGVGGKVLTNIDTAWPGSNDSGLGVAAYQSDGKLIVVGESDGDMVAVRYNPDGSLDATFGTGGKVRIDFGGTLDYGQSVAVDSQGRVLVAGQSLQVATAADFAVARLTSAGVLDATFGVGGKQTIDFGYEEMGWSVAVDAQDRVLVAGHARRVGTTAYDFAVARLSAAGVLDAAFDGDGRQTIHFGSNDNYGYSVAVDSQDRVLVAGQSLQGATGNDFAVARLTATGALDSAFDGDGKRTIDFAGKEDVGRGVAVDSQGRVLVAGYFHQGNPFDRDFAVARLTATGALDAAFDGDGRQTIHFSNNEDVGWSVAVDAQDRVLVAGTSVQGGTTGTDFAVVRLTAAGVLDAVFDGDGKQTIDFGGTSDFANSVAVDSQDRVLVAGTSNRGGPTHLDIAVARLLSDNVAPTASASNSGPIDEGSQVLITVTASDPDGANDQLTYEYDFNNDGIYDFGPTANNTHSFVFADSGPHVVKIRVRDGNGGEVVTSTTVTVNNVAPTVGDITAPLDPVAANTAMSASATFTDPGVNDTHTATWYWGDGSSSPGSVTEAGGAGTATGSHAYAAAGVYTVRLVVTDSDGDSTERTFQYVVVYDPSAGFVTGGGWIDSPAGAYAANLSLAGKANFGFVSKYQPGNNVPTGNTEFQFRVADFTFKSTSYDWLVVAGPKAQYKGTGKVNGSGDYGFLLTATDGQRPGGGGVDKFRIKIWDRVTGAVVYDNQMGLDDNGDPTTALGGGSIQIHS